MISTPLVVLTPLTVISCSSNSSHKETILSKDEVLNNFKEGKKWYGKTSLTYNDFNGYKSLNINAFDEIKLNAIELPSSIKINSNNDEVIKWKNINEIKVYNQESKNIFVNDNILFYYQEKYIGYYVASTISNRKDKITIEFSCKNNMHNSVQYIIPDYFYDKDIFKNVESISFLEKQSFFYIGKSAFENCKILNKELIINFDSSLSFLYFWNFFLINEKAFKNTNIESISIIDNNDIQDTLKLSSVLLGIESFSNNINLKKFEYTKNSKNNFLGIDEKCFF